jgi:DNA-binding protein HU-beta
MTNQQLIDYLTDKTKLPKRDVLRVMRAFTETTMSRVSQGEKVGLTGFGVFYLGQRSQRQGRNPQTGELISIPAMPMPGFRAGKSFKERVRGE